MGVKVKSVKLDKDAHSILLIVKYQMKNDGIEYPSMSDAIRYLFRKSEKK